MESAQGQHDQVHDQEDGDSVEQPAHQKMIAQKFKLAAGQAIDYGSGEGDEEMKHNAEHPCRRTSLQGLSSDQTLGNDFWDFAAVGEKCGNQIERAGSGATRDGREQQS